ncbi:hypothetical protein EON83_23050 [bacterium]|nr:MAG: hypothetical protein EON83_23050 [bacterium]
MKYMIVKSAFFAKCLATSAALAIFVVAMPLSHADPTFNLTGVTPAKATPPAEKPYISPGVTMKVGGEGTRTADISNYKCLIKYTISKDNAPNAASIVFQDSIDVSPYQTTSLNREWDATINDFGDYGGLYWVKITPMNGVVPSNNFFSDGKDTSFVIGYKPGIPGGPLG